MRDRKDAADERPAATMPVTAITPSSDGRTFCPAQMKATSLGEIPSLKRLMEKPPKVRKRYVTASAAVAKSADRMATCSFLAMRKRLDCHRSEEHTSELLSRFDLVCRLLLEKKNPDSSTAE